MVNISRDNHLYRAGDYLRLCLVSKWTCVCVYKYKLLPSGLQSTSLSVVLSPHEWANTFQQTMTAAFNGRG